MVQYSVFRSDATNHVTKTGLLFGRQPTPDLAKMDPGLSYEVLQRLGDRFRVTLGRDEMRPEQLEEKRMPTSPVPHEVLFLLIKFVATHPNYSLRPVGLKQSQPNTLEHVGDWRCLVVPAKNLVGQLPRRENETGSSKSQQGAESLEESKVNSPYNRIDIVNQDYRRMTPEVD